MKKAITYLSFFFLLFGLVGCSSESSSTPKETKKGAKSQEEKNDEPLSEEEFVKMISDPKKYKNSKVDFYAKVFTEPEKDDDGTYLQVYADNNSDRNVIVGIENPDLEVKLDDVIHVTGTVKDVFEGENAMGGTVTAPVIKADKIEVSDYATAFSPTLKTIDVNKEMEQHGFLLKVNKIEIAENETRVFVNITNNSKDTISFFSFNSKLIVDNKQLELLDNYDANYPEVQSEILPGIQSEGVILFPKIPETGSIKLFMEGSSDNYNLTFNPFEIELTY